MKPKDIIKILKADGWYEIKSNSGSHKQFKHETKKGRVTVPFHNKDLAIGTLHSIWQQADIKISK